jgi:hypothetical protein
MIKHNIRTFATVIIGLAFIVYAIIFVSFQNLESIDFNQAISDIFKTISINVILWLLFVNWAWKWRIWYPWLVPFPNLNGNWEGHLKSNYKNKSLDPIPSEVSINQTFFNVQVKIKTGESRSYSTGASFDIDKERGIQQLIYSYLNTPKSSVRERSEIHYGTTLLIFDGFKVDELEGQYWTDRETTGEILMRRKNVA